MDGSYLNNKHENILDVIGWLKEYINGEDLSGFTEEEFNDELEWCKDEQEEEQVRHTKIGVGNKYKFTNEAIEKMKDCINQLQMAYEKVYAVDKLLTGYWEEDYFNEVYAELEKICK